MAFYKAFSEEKLPAGSCFFEVGGCIILSIFIAEMKIMEQKPVTAIIVGAGHRAFVYSKLALTNPELLKIVGVADPDPIRRKKAMDMFGFPEENCFEDADNDRLVFTYSISDRKTVAAQETKDGLLELTALATGSVSIAINAADPSGARAKNTAQVLQRYD